MLDAPTGRRAPATGSSADLKTMRRFGARWIGLLAATLIALYLCWRMIEPFVEVMLWATVLVIIFYPAHQRILRRVGRPNLAALLSCLFVGLMILGPLTLITIAIANEAGGAADALHAGVVKLLDPGSRVRLFLDRWVDVSDFTGDQWRKALVEWVQERGGTLAGQTAQIAGRVLRALIQVVLVVFTMYYLFRDGERVKRALHDVLPLEWEQSHAIFLRTHEVISASVYGVVVIAAIQGTLGGLAFWALGLPSPLMWGAVMVLLSMIPVVGSTIVWVPTALYLLLTGHWIKASLLAGWGAGVIAMIDNILRPRLVGGRTRLHELIVFFSVLGGLQVFGILGLVVGPVVVAITLALLDVFRAVQRPEVVMSGGHTLAEEQAALREVEPEVVPGRDAAQGDAASVLEHRVEAVEHQEALQRDVDQPQHGGVGVEQARDQDHKDKRADDQAVEIAD